MTASRLRRAWEVFDRPAHGPVMPGTVPVFVVGVTLGAIASVVSIRSGHNFDYPDTLSHLTIARRVLDSESPGTQQLGAVWPPFPHLLVFPLVQWMWLWSTGIAAAIVGSLSVGVASAGLYRILARLGCDATGRLLGLLVLWANPNYLYLSTTALTEPVLLATTLAGVAGLLRWSTTSRQLSGGELAVFAGLPVAAGVLSRYEGWSLTVAGAGYVAIVSGYRHLPWRRGMTLVASFAAPSIVAVLAWFAYNFAMFGDPFDFARGPYSVAQAIVELRGRGLLTTEGQFGLSLHTYFGGMLGVAGLATVVVATVGLLAVSVRWGVDHRALAIWVLAAPTAFLVYGLWAGHYVMLNADSIPVGIMNNRLALSSLPWLAALCGCLLTRPAVVLPRTTPALSRVPAPSPIPDSIPAPSAVVSAPTAAISPQPIPALVLTASLAGGAASSLVGGATSNVHGGQTPSLAVDPNLVLTSTPVPLDERAPLAHSPVPHQPSNLTRWLDSVARLAVVGIVTLALATQNSWWLTDLETRSPVLAEAAIGHQGGVDRTQAATWLRENYDGGGLLIDNATLSCAPLLGIGLREQLNTEDEPRFTAALNDPSRYARWVLMHRLPAPGAPVGQESGDRVTKAFRANDRAQLDYRMVYAVGDLVVYRRVEGLS